MRMRAPYLAAAACAALFVAGAVLRADAGPVKHWGTFPGREVRALALRGYVFGAEPSYTTVQGRDGYVYLRGRFGLYRVLDADGTVRRVADTSQCGGWTESHGADLRTLVPRAICSRASEIIVASSRVHVHLRMPVPTTPDAFSTVGTYRVDERFLTDVVPADDGGYWFAYGDARTVGRSGPGVARLLHLDGLGRVRGIAVRGGDLYVVDDKCTLGHVRAMELVEAARFDAVCRPSGIGPPLVSTRDGAVWVLHGPFVERIGPDGCRRDWRLGMFASGVAVTRDGTAYVLGSTSLTYTAHPVVAVIPPHGLPDVRVLPMRSVGHIAVDGRDRIWISDPGDHGAAVIAPAGAWN